jgi:hypothetical protein
MYICRITLVAALLLGGISSLQAMNNADLIKLKKADFSDETLLLSINKEPADYDTSPDGLVELKKAGLSEDVIQRVVSRNSGETSAPAASSSGASSSSSSPTAELFSVESPEISPPAIEPTVGKDYFTRFTLHAEDHEYPVTNYARGDLVPINTPVKLINMSGKKFTLRRLDSGGDIEVENIEKYSHLSLSEVAARMLSAEKTPIEKLVPTLQKAIKEGEMRRGMTKDQVIMARGYPPAHETASTDSDRWVFWSSRFVKQTIVFTNGRLTEGRGTY